MMAPTMSKNTMKSTPMTMQMGSMRQKRWKKWKKFRRRIHQFQYHAPRKLQKPKGAVDTVDLDRKVAEAKKQRIEEFHRLAAELDIDVSELTGEDKNSQATDSKVLEERFGRYNPILIDQKVGAI